MKQKNKMLSHKDVKTLFETRLTQLTSLAAESRNETIFKNKLNDYLLSAHIKNPIAAKNITRLIENDSKTIYELSTEKEIEIKTISLLWQFLTNRITDEETSVDLWLDLYQQFLRLYHVPNNIPNEKQIRQWMKRWPGGLNEDVRAIRNANKERIISLLIKKIENRHAPSSRYVFPEGINDEEKRQWVNQWWNEARFHLALAIKSPTELNKMLGNSLSEETMQLYQQARKKGMPFFITPYYLSLLNPTGKGYHAGERNESIPAADADPAGGTTGGGGDDRACGGTGTFGRAAGKWPAAKCGGAAGGGGDGNSCHPAQQCWAAGSPAPHREFFVPGAQWSGQDPVVLRIGQNAVWQ